MGGGRGERAVADLILGSQTELTLARQLRAPRYTVSLNVRRFAWSTTVPQRFDSHSMRYDPTGLNCVG